MTTPAARGTRHAGHSRPALARRLSRLLGAALLPATLLAACATPVAVRFHTLLPETPPQPIAEAVPGQARLPFILDRVRVPASVDQPQWLVRLPDQSLALLEQERWASPLADELQRAWSERLRLRYGLQQAQTPAQRGAAMRIDVAVTRFESIPGQLARVAADWTLTPPHGGKPASCSLQVQQPVAEGIAALAAGQRQAVEQIGDAIASQLLALQRGAKPSCPAVP